MNNSFSLYGTNYINENRTRRKRNTRSTNRISINNQLYNQNFTDINDNYIRTKNDFLKKIKIKENITSIKSQNKTNNNNTNKIYNNFLINSNHNKYNKLKNNDKNILNNSSMKVKSLSNSDYLKIINNNENKNDKLIHNNNFILKAKNNINSLNKTKGCFRLKNTKKILNFLEFYNINSNKKETEKESNKINMNSISYKTMNNIYENKNKNRNRNKLFYDIKHVKDINSKIINNIEKSEDKIKLKRKQFNKKYKKNALKFFGNEEIKLLKYNGKQMQKKKNRLL